MPTTPATETLKAVHWGGVIAGAIAAAALAFVLHAFAAAIGLATSSTTPTWRDGSAALWILSGLYLLLVALATYGLGGYIAGYMRPKLPAAAGDEAEVRDGVHGLAVWALATILTALIALSAAQSLTRLAAPSGGIPGPSNSVAAENIIADDLDRLFRAPKRADVTSLTYARAEAGRILLSASGHEGVSGEDRNYLALLVSSQTGLAPDAAQQRVTQVIASARENMSRARQSSVLLAFMAGASALVGAAAAWFAAVAGGQHRDGGTVLAVSSPDLFRQRGRAAKTKS
jgi:hypothetical protein